ncbi:class A beta-lactamase [Mycolicibacterium sediminis]|uniref:Beta-lactamase n=1 Tax=Mycolicibacterium sediminis TaxID=1286180 RepID=A0A7I7QSZ8_9MYCO|nr:class A beta-lactamase [Mycolicibacterium sediminis]BBY29414.1 beta-lactamase [Mycolicibacterium sediminis]
MRRRSLLIGAGALAALAACSEAPAPAEPVAPPMPPVEDRIGALERTYGAYVGVYAENLDTQTSVAHRADDPFAMCSTFKAYAAGRVLQKAAAGELNLTDAVTIEQSDILPNSPITETRVGRNMTIEELCVAAVERSDNAAANWLLRIIGGPSRITDFARTLGDDRTRLDRWEPELNAAVPGDPRDTSTPRAIGSGFRSMLTGEALAEPERRTLDRWMRGNQTSSMRPGLGPGWTTADKTGSGDYGSTNDVGIAYGPDGQRLLLSFMTRTRSDDPDAEAMRPLIGELATLIVPYVTV